MQWHAHMWQTHKVMHQKQLKEVSSNHEDASDAALPVHTLSDPTTQMSWVKEPIHIACIPFYTKWSHDLPHMQLVTSLVMSLHPKMMLHHEFNNDVRISDVL